MDPITVVLAVAGIAIGFGANTVVTRRKLGSAEAQAQRELAKAKKDADKVLAQARDQANELTNQARKEDQNRRREFKDVEQRLLDCAAAKTR
jgi:cell division septum initiation protein DivIVA